MNVTAGSSGIRRASVLTLLRQPCRRYNSNHHRVQGRTCIRSTRAFSSHPVHRALESTKEPINAAPEIDIDESPENSGRTKKENPKEVLKRIRVIPASPSYFSAKPQFTDDVVSLQKLLRRHQTLPTVPASEAPRVEWRALGAFRTGYDEKIRGSRHARVVSILERLNRIHPAMMPEEVQQAILQYGTYIDVTANKPKPEILDEFGRARGIGRRKSSSAKVYLVEGEGEVLINGKPIHHVFGRVHDRESVLWALKTTRRIDKYNVFGLVSGGGTTGQAEALTLGIARALVVHEPALKSSLRKVGVIHRDPRRVERKKPGKVKARKMPAWVKR